MIQSVLPGKLSAVIDASPKPALFGGRSSDVLNTHYGLDTAVMSHVERAWEGPDAAPETEETTTPPPAEGEEEETVEHESISTPSPCWESALNALERDQLKRVRQKVIDELGLPAEAVSLQDAAIVRQVMAAVARRAAKLSAVAIAATMVQTERAVLGGEAPPPAKDGEETRIGVAVDRSLIEHYPNFIRLMRESLRVLIGEETEQRVDIDLAKDGSGVGAALCALQAVKQAELRGKQVLSEQPEAEDIPEDLSEDTPEDVSEDVPDDD
ncbi:hypothetical protein HWV62_4331 [Athelia sp. TMB]|nr:hypothetical protein HWV62_4331 [Athelia sp. TMB]